MDAIECSLFDKSLSDSCVNTNVSVFMEIGSVGDLRRGSDPLKLIEQLQSYITKLQNTAKEIPRCPPRRFYEKLSFDFQSSRDLPPIVRAVVEDNRMMKDFIRKWRTRCLSSEKEALRERRRAEQLSTELIALRETITEDQRIAVRSFKELENENQMLKSEVRMKENAIEVLQKKLQVDARRHHGATLDQERDRTRLECEISHLQSKLNSMTRNQRAEAIETRRLAAKYDQFRKKANEWKQQLDGIIPQSSTSAEEDKADDSITTVDKETFTDQLQSENVVLLFIVLNGSSDDDRNAAKQDDGRLSLENGDDEIRAREAEAKEKTENAAIRIQCAVRRMLARREVQRRRIQAANRQQKVGVSRVNPAKNSTQNKSAKPFTRSYLRSRNRKPNLS